MSEVARALSANEASGVDAADASVLIVGAGHAGVAAARALRGLGHRGRLLLLGDESHLPYERPPLSKEVIQQGARTAAMDLLTAEDLANLEIGFRPDWRVTALDPGLRRAYDARGVYEAYDHCVLATGGVARELVGLPRGAPGVHYVRTLDDATRLARELDDGGAVLVIGAGYLGLEAASSVAARGQAVMLVDVASQLLSRAAPPMLAEWLQVRCAERGIRVLLGRERLSTVREQDGYVVTLIDGEQLRASVIVVAVGQQPQVSLARTAGVAIDPVTGGIEIDAGGRTSVPGIHAAGDCASQWHPWYGARVRLESWQSANEQGAIVAADIMGQPHPVRSVPWFWTDVLGCNVQMLGAPPPGTALDYTVRGELDAAAGTPKCLLLGMAGRRLAHVVAINTGGDLRALRPLLEQVRDVDVGALADTGRPLRAIVKAWSEAA